MDERALATGAVTRCEREEFLKIAYPSRGTLFSGLGFGLRF